MPSADTSSLATWLSRAALGVSGVGLLVGGVATIAMVRTLWTPAPGVDVEAYALVDAVHRIVFEGLFSPTAAMAAIVPLVVTPTGGTRGHGRVPLALAALGTLAWIVSILVLALHARPAFTFTGEPELWPYIAAWSGALALAAFASALVISVIANLRVIPATRSLTAAAWAGTAGIAVAFSVIAIVKHGDLPSTMLQDAVQGETQFWGLLVSVALATVAIAMLEGARVASPALVFAALGVLPAFIGERFIGRIALFSDLDVYLHDTYFAVGREHLVQTAAFAALLAAVHLFDLRIFGRKARPALAWPGAVLTCGGLVAQAVLMMVLGTRGMPRHYASYPPEFANLHHASLAAGMVAMLGIILVVAAWLWPAQADR